MDSLQILSGMPSHDILGHSDPRITMGIYTQVLDNEIDETGVVLAKAIA